MNMLWRDISLPAIFYYYYRHLPLNHQNVRVKFDADATVLFSEQIREFIQICLLKYLFDELAFKFPENIRIVFLHAVISLTLFELLLYIQIFSGRI